MWVLLTCLFSSVELWCNFIIKILEILMEMWVNLELLWEGLTSLPLPDLLGVCLSLFFFKVLFWGRLGSAVG